MALLLAPMAAQAGVLELTNFSQRVFWGVWQYTDSDGNLVSVQVNGGENSTRGPNPSNTPTPSLAVSVLKATADGSTVLLSGVGETEQFTFDVDPQLNQAHVVGTMDFFNEGVGALYPMTVDMTFTATSDLHKNTSHTHFQEGGFKYNAHFKGNQRDAIATGSVIYEGLNGAFPDPRNGTFDLTPIPTSDASMEKDTAGFVLIQID